jgi:hypothetical protein
MKPTFNINTGKPCCITRKSDRSKICRSATAQWSLKQHPGCLRVERGNSQTLSTAGR